MNQAVDIYASSQDSVDEDLQTKTGPAADAAAAAEQHALGLGLFKQGQPQSAMEHWEQAVTLAPDNAGYLKDLADLYYSALNQPRQALECYRKLLVLNPHDQDVLTLAANIAVAMGDFQQALADYKALAALGPLRIDLLEVIEKLEQYSTHSAERTEKMLQQAQNEMRSGENEKARAILELVLQHTPEHAIAHNDMGVVQCALGEWSLARNHFEKAVELAPEDTTCLKNLADFYVAAGVEIENALHLYLKILQTNPQDVETLFAAGSVSESFEQFETAGVFYEAVLAIEPWHLQASEKLAALPAAGVGAEDKKNTTSESCI